MPNALDLSETASLFQTITDNYVVLALLCAFFGLYLATVLWAWYSDRQALVRVRTYLYHLVTVILVGLNVMLFGFIEQILT